MLFKKAIKSKQFNSKWEMKVFKTLSSVLPSNLQPIKINKRIPGYRFELDFYLPKINIAFELQGPLHSINLKNVRRDLIKKSICNSLGIHVIYLMFYKNYSKNYFINVLKSYNKNGII